MMTIVSVTRFGKSLQVFCKILTVYFLFSNKLSLIWQKNHYWAHFHFCKWPNIEK